MTVRHRERKVNRICARVQAPNPRNTCTQVWRPKAELGWRTRSLRSEAEACSILRPVNGNAMMSQDRKISRRCDLATGVSAAVFLVLIVAAPQK
jgi:hypothetical protein